MKDMNTYTLMLELCSRLTDHLYNPIPNKDSVFDDMTEPYAHSCLHDLHDRMYAAVKEYQSQVKARSEAE